MASWPLYVKGPIDDGNLKITLGTSVAYHETADGRMTGYRQGANAPDVLECVLVLPASKRQYFQEYYERTLNLGLNWMAPTWLEKLGYDSHSVRFLGYPTISAAGPDFIQYQARFLIQQTALVQADISWPEKTAT